MNKHLKKILLTVSFLLFLIIPPRGVFAQEDSTTVDESVNIYFFWGVGCPHCEKEKEYLKELKKNYPQVNVLDFEVWNNKENLDLMTQFAKTLGVDVRGVPFTVVGDHHIEGWLSDEYTGRQLEEAVSCALAKGCQDLGKGLITQEGQDEDGKKNSDIVGIPEKMDLPLIGEIETKDFSLPLLTILLGFVDGFNPCAMWTLVFLIGLLLGLKDRKRMWVLGIVFIFTSAFVYFLFMAAWLNFILFIGMVNWVRMLIGLVALLGGGYSLREFWVNKNGSCKVTNKGNRKEVFEKLKMITKKKSFWLAIGGIILLAFAVNLVEAICSAGIPAVYTQILSLNNLSTLEYYLYILLYIFFFMLDDLIVFFVAMTTLRMTGANSKYSRLSSLIGGVLMVLVGLLLIFKPEWLMFG